MSHLCSDTSVDAVHRRTADCGGEVYCVDSCLYATGLLPVLHAIAFEPCVTSEVHIR